MSEMKLWSVTTLIKQALGMGPGLVKHTQRTVAGIAYDRVKTLGQFVEDGERDEAIKWLLDAQWSGVRKAATRGTDIHKAAEELALGVAPEVDDDILPFVQQYVRFLEDLTPTFVMAEAPVYNPERGYAGTCDGIVEIDGSSLIFDIKTTAHGPESSTRRPPFPEVALQLAAYRYATDVGVLSEQRYSGQGQRYYIFDPDEKHEPMPTVEGAVCIVVSPEDYTVVPVRTDEVVWKAWRHVIEVARFQVVTSRELFGPPITVMGKVVG